MDGTASTDSSDVFTVGAWRLWKIYDVDKLSTLMSRESEGLGPMAERWRLFVITGDKIQVIFGLLLLIPLAVSVNMDRENRLLRYRPTVIMEAIPLVVSPMWCGLSLF